MKDVPTNNIPPMEVLSPEELAQMLKLDSPKVLYEMTRSRSTHPLPFIRVAGKLRFLASEINDWILNQRNLPLRRHRRPRKQISASKNRQKPEAA